MNNITDTAYYPISLGSSCGVKFQICRKMHQILYPEKSELSLRLKLIPPEYGERFFGKSLFDWQGSPMDSISESIERDFEGLFDRSDLEITPLGTFHKTLGTNLSHYFDKAIFQADIMPESLLDLHYPSANVLHQRLCREFQKHLSDAGPFLYIHGCNAFPTVPQVERLIRALSARSADHRFHLLIVGLKERDQDYLSLGDQVTKAYRSGEHGKPADRDWEDNDADWDAAFAPFNFAIPAKLQALGSKPAPAKPQPEAAPPKSKGFFSWLSGKS